MRKTLGFTLVELLITVSIVAILAGIAAPSFQTMIQNNRVTTESNKIISALKVARTEAIRRSGFVTLCRTSSTTACNDGTGTLLIFRDTATTNTGTPVVGEVLKVLNGGPTDVTVTADTAATFFRYNSTGRLATTAANITIVNTGCTTGQARAKEIRLGQDGHATIRTIDCP